MAEADPKRIVGKPARKVAESFAAKRVAWALDTVAAAGLTEGRKLKRLSGRAHQRLFDAAAANSGLDGSDLLEYALAKVALEDDFVETLLSLEGSIPRDIDLEF